MIMTFLVIILQPVLLPKSTLFMLISALTGLQKAQEIYEYAKNNIK